MKYEMKDSIIKKYLAFARGPIHIGGQRASSVSSTARDVDGFPYIPASSLKGCIRALCSMDFAAQGCDTKGWNCSQPHKCPSCTIFGFSNNNHGGTASSLVRFSNASLVLIPLHCEYGLFWITSWHRLQLSGINPNSLDSLEKHWVYTECIPIDIIKWVEAVLNYHSDLPKAITTDTWRGSQELQYIFKRTIR